MRLAVRPAPRRTLFACTWRSALSVLALGVVAPQNVNGSSQPGLCSSEGSVRTRITVRDPTDPPG